MTITPLTVLITIAVCASLAGLITAAIMWLRRKFPHDRTFSYLEGFRIAQARARQSVGRTYPEGLHATDPIVEAISSREPLRQTRKLAALAMSYDAGGPGYTLGEDPYTATADALFAEGRASDRAIMLSAAHLLDPAVDPIPAGVYWGIDGQAFYDENGHNLGIVFSEAWWPRMDEFPKR